VPGSRDINSDRVEGQMVTGLRGRNPFSQWVVQQTAKVGLHGCSSNLNICRYKINTKHIP
jgi:hypothetical protein